MNLAIDIGNSLVKIGCFEKSKLLPPVHIVTIKQLKPKIDSFKPQKVIVGTVAANLGGLDPAGDLQYTVNVLDHDTPLPFTIAYKTPETLGVDRIAAVAGAQVINPEATSMIIDVGTCITYDLIDSSGFFHGGVISPGIDLRFKAMHNFTGNLPLIEDYDKDDLVGTIGKTTKEAMESGVLNGIKGEMESLIRSYQEMYPDLKVIMCGGQAKFFESRLKASIFAVPELVLLGLNRILEFNDE